MGDAARCPAQAAEWQRVAGGPASASAFEGERRLHLRRYPIQMHVHDGILRLEGEVEDVVAKTLALRLAAAVAGVEGIVDRLQVAPELPMGDDAIRAVFVSQKAIKFLNTACR